MFPLLVNQLIPLSKTNNLSDIWPRCNGVQVQDSHLTSDSSPVVSHSSVLPSGTCSVMGKRKAAGVFLSSPFPLQNLQTYNNSNFVQFPEFQTERRKKPASSAQILLNPASQVIVEFCFPSRYFTFSRILHCIWAKSRIPKIPFHTLCYGLPKITKFTNLTIFR